MSLNDNKLPFSVRRSSEGAPSDEELGREWTDDELKGSEWTADQEGTADEFKRSKQLFAAKVLIFQEIVSKGLVSMDHNWRGVEEALGRIFEAPYGIDHHVFMEAFTWASEMAWHEHKVGRVAEHIGGSRHDAELAIILKETTDHLARSLGFDPNKPPEGQVRREA